MPERGCLLSCVARDPVLSQPSALPHWQRDSKTHLELQELRLHLTEEALPSQGSVWKFILPGSPQQTFPCGSLLRARSCDSPALLTTKGTGTTMTGLHPPRSIPRLQGTGALHLNTSAGEEKQQGLQQGFSQNPSSRLVSPSDWVWASNGRNSVSPSIRNIWTLVLVPN